VQLTTKTTANRITASVKRTCERNHLQLRFTEAVLQLAVGLVVICIVRSCPDTLLHSSVYLLRIFFMSSLPQQSRACTAGHVSNHKIHCCKSDAGRLFSSSALGRSNRSKHNSQSPSLPYFRPEINSLYCMKLMTQCRILTQCKKQGCGAVVKITLLRLRSSLFSQHGSSFGFCLFLHINIFKMSWCASS